MERRVDAIERLDRAFVGRAGTLNPQHRLGNLGFAENATAMAKAITPSLNVCIPTIPPIGCGTGTNRSGLHYVRGSSAGRGRGREEGPRGLASAALQQRWQQRALRQLKLQLANPMPPLQLVRKLRIRGRIRLKQPGRALLQQAQTSCLKHGLELRRARSHAPAQPAD
jgi:hypothetical protein